MKAYRIRSVEVSRYPVLHVTFVDGLSGEIDLTREIATGSMFEPLRDEAYFRTVSVSEDGRTFGWNLDDLGNEIEFCPDATRTEIETNVVRDRAERYRASRQAAE